jgi:hypothetical protein
MPLLPRFAHPLGVMARQEDLDVWRGLYDPAPLAHGRRLVVYRRARDSLADLPISRHVSCQPHRGISAENRLLRPCQQDRPVLVLLCGTPCKYGLWRSWREPVNSGRLYKRSRPLLRVGSRGATLCLFVTPHQRTVLQDQKSGMATDYPPVISLESLKFPDIFLSTSTWIWSCSSRSTSRWRPWWSNPVEWAAVADTLKVCSSLPLIGVGSAAVLRVTLSSQLLTLFAQLAPLGSWLLHVLHVHIYNRHQPSAHSVKDLGFIGSWRQEQTIELTQARLT